MPDSDLFNQLKNELDLIKKYPKFSSYFDAEFKKYNLHGIKYRIFKNWAEDIYRLAQLDIVVTSIKYSDLTELISAGSVSYMGKYKTFNQIKINA